MLEKKNINPFALLEAVQEAGYAALLDIGTDADDIPGRKDLLRNYPFAYMAVGLYPSNCDNAELPSLLKIIEESLSEEKVVAIGEIGLDYHWNYGSREQQRSLVESELEMAKSHNLPVVIHNRDADADIVGILKEAELSRRGIIHCFSSDKKTAGQLLDLGYYLSFAGNVTYPSSTAIQEALAYVPDDRLLLETDSPYLAPQAKRGKANHPGYIQFIYSYAASLRRCRIESLIPKVKNNFVNLFNVSLRES